MRTLILGLLLLGGFTALAQPAYTDTTIEMRDGKFLAADFYLPSGPGPFPTILIQTPYNKNLFRIALPLGVVWDIDAYGYAFVVVDKRGFFGSAAAVTPGSSDGEDGYDVVEWIAQQPWSDGKIGTWGPSALARVQYQTMQQNPPHLVCAVPLVAGSQFNYQEYFPSGSARTEYIQQLDGLGFGVSPVLYANPLYNLIWGVAEDDSYYPDDLGKPCLMIGGWYDHNVDLMLDLFAGMKANSPDSVKAEHKLLFGPWVHGGHGTAYVGSVPQGELSYPAGGGWSDSLAMRFFDYYLKGEANGWETTPDVVYFQMGEDAWHNAGSWPPPTAWDTLYLTTGNELLTAMQTGTASPLSYTYDPKDPSPSIGGPLLRSDLDQGPYDQGPLVESRDDNLIFTTPVLEEDAVVKGGISVKLYVSSDRTGTDFCVRLTDVYPDGRSMLLRTGTFRMKFLDGFTAADTTDIVPGQVYPLTIELEDVAHTFVAGHQIRLIVTSSNHPQYSLNLNNGNTLYSAGDTLIAENSLHISSEYPSKIILPVVNPIVTGIKDIVLARAALKLYPNPAINMLYIDTELSIEELRINQLDGKLLLLQESPGQSINISNLPNGVYLCTILSSEGIITRKLAVLR